MTDPPHSSLPITVILSTDIPAQTSLQKCLNDLGLADVHLLHSWDQINTENQLGHPALVFVGWDLWGSKALEWITRLKQIKETARPATIFLILPKEHSIDRVAAVHSGVDGFISHPYSLPNVRQKLQAVRPDVAVHPPPNALSPRRTTRPKKKQPPARIS